MTPAFKIEADTVDVTAKIKDRLTEITLTSETDATQDTLELLLDDRDNALVTPRKGAELKVYLGFKETELFDFGTFTVDEVEISGTPDALRITAKAANVSDSTTKAAVDNGIKSQRSRSWHEVTFGEMVETIASEHGYEARVHDALSNIPIPHIDQLDESDMNLLSRFAIEHDALLKVADKKIVLIPKGMAQNASAATLSPVIITKSQVKGFRMMIADGRYFKSVTAHWKDLDANMRVAETVGDGDPAKVLKEDFADAAAAKSAAQADFKRMERGKSTGTIELPGTPSIKAGMHVDLQDFRTEFNGVWHVKQATHTLGGSGFTTSIELEAPTQ